MLTYAGQPLDFDWNQQVQDFIDWQQREDETVIFPESISRSTWQTNPVRNNNRIGLPRFNWPAPPPVKMNQLYWPCTGANRWAFGVFLITSATYEALAKAELLECHAAHWLTFNTPTTPKEGTINSAADTLVRFPMFPLAAKRLAGCHASDRTAVAVDEWFLLPLVDFRYWWQFANVGDIKSELYGSSSAADCEKTCSITWETLLTYLTGKSGATWSIDSVASYSNGPDCDEFNRPRENLGCILDAAAASVGAKVVAKLDGTFAIERPETSAAITTVNFGTLKNQTAGTYCYRRNRLEMPSKVEVVAKVLRCNSPLCDDEEYVTTVNASDWCGPDGTVKTIHIPGYADMGCDCDNETPENEVELNALANVIASDYYASVTEVYDVTYDSPQAWTPNGFDDHILIKCGVEEHHHDEATAEQDQRTPDQQDPLLWAMVHPQYRRIHQTRIQSLPLNVGVDCQLHRTDVDLIQDSVVRFELTEDLCRGDCATAKVISACCGEDGTDSGVEIEVCDVLNLICENTFYGASTSSAGDCEVTTACGCVPSGSTGTARFDPLSCRWELANIELCQEDTRYWIEAIDCIIPGETGSGKLLRRGPGGDLETICDSVEVDDTDCLVLALPGERFPVEGTDCQGGTWHPSTTFGLNRRVRIKRDGGDCGLACGLVGPATVLEMGETTSGETEECTWSESDCEIDVCNQTGHPLACGEDVTQEDAEVRFDPSTCEFVAFQGYRPFTAKVQLYDGLCESGTAQFQGTPSFPTICYDWTETIGTAANPYQLQGCSGDFCELRLSVTDCKCTWEIIQIQEHEHTLPYAIRYSKTCSGDPESLTSCKLEYLEIPISVHECVCAEPDVWQTLIELESIDVVVDTGGIYTADCDPGSSSGSPGSAVLQLKRQKICVFPSCGEPEVETIDAWAMTAESVVVFLHDEADCLYATVATIMVPAVCDSSDEPIICGYDCDTSSSS